MAIKRTYPRLPNIKDQDVKETTRLLWDASHDKTDEIAALSARLATLESTVQSIQASLTKVSTQVTAIAATNVDEPDTTP